MRVLTVVGNRPQFIKAAAVSHRLREGAEEVLVHTGQHYDEELSQVFFTELGLPAPEHHLELGGGSNTAQTARMLEALEGLLASERPDLVLVYGDTNSTLAGALAAAQAQVPGRPRRGRHALVRPRDAGGAQPRADRPRRRRCCCARPRRPRANLRAERVAGRIEVVGDVMVDIALLLGPRAAARTEVLEAHGVQPGDYVLVTAHRAGNVDDPARLRQLVELIEALPYPVVFPVHPRTRARLEAAGLLDRLPLGPPLGYLEFTALLHHARAVLTDSGGVQKEAYLAATPCITLRSTTEWTETVDAGWNVLVDLDAEAALAALERRPPAERPQLYGDGRAGERVVAALRMQA